jgi:MFS family permease
MPRMIAGSRLFFGVTLPLTGLNFLNQASRTVMAIIGPVLAVEFGLSASELGLLAACMFASYGLAQLPVGIALDTIGPRRLQAGLSLVAAAGFAVFALSSSLAGFSVARVLLGVGMSAGLMSILKANTLWFLPTQVAGMTGIAMAISSLGSVATTSPVQWALPVLGWRGVFWLLAGAAFAVSLWIFLSVRDKLTAAPRRGLKDELAVMGAIFASRPFWRYGPPVAFLSASNFAYLGLWAGPWLRDVAGYDGAARAQTLFLYTLAMMAGGAINGQIASRLQASGYPALFVPVVCIAGLLAAQLGLALQPANGAAVLALWLAFAFFASGAAPAYIAVGQMFPVEQMGRVSTAINSLTLAGAFLLQSAVGWILDLWPRTAAGGWDSRGYSAALLVSVAMQVLASVHLARWTTGWIRRRH